ncbi:MAG: helix-turn-helix domain-containing protein [Burkholderiales bacterium]|nr:helix-turn-helix domain-containing protein [Burkholderiales bacterium]
MSALCIAAVWRARIVPSGRKLVAASLADRADDDGGSIWFSKEKIAERCSMSPRQVQTHLGRLVDAGILEIARAATQHHPVHYRLSLRRLDELVPGDGASQGRSTALPGEKHSAARGEAQRCQGRSAALPGEQPASPDTPQDVRRDVLGGEASAVVPPGGVTTATPPAPPPGVDPAAWRRLLAARPDLNAADVAEAAWLHLASGCDAEALGRAVDALRLNRHHRSLSPIYRRTPPARKPKTALEGAGSPAVPAPAPKPAAIAARQFVPPPLRGMPPHPVQSAWRSITRGRAANREERDRLAETLRRQYPQHFAAVAARPGYGPVLVADEADVAGMLALLGSARDAIAARVAREQSQGAAAA